MKQNRYLSLFSDTIIFAVGNLLAKFIMLFMMPLYTSVLTQSEYGTADLINNLSELIGPLVTICIFEAVFRFAVDANCDNRKLLSHALKVQTTGFFVLLMGTYIFNAFIKYDYIWYWFIVTFTSSFKLMFSSYARGIGKTKCFAVAGIINAFVLCASNVILLAVLKMNVNGYLISIIIANIVTMLYLIIGSKAYKDISFEKTDKKYLKTLAAFSVPLILNNVSWWAINISGRYIILGFSGLEMAGLYSATIKLPSLINTATGIFQRAWQLTAARESDTSDREKFFSNVLRAFSTFLMLFASIVITCVPFISKLMLKGEFIAGSTYLPLMLLTSVLNCYNVFFGIFYTAYKKTKMIMVSTITGAVINLGISILLVPKIGIWGTVAAGTVSYLAIVLIRMKDTARFVKIKKDYAFIIPSFLVITIQIIAMTVKYPYFQAVSVALFIFLVFYTMIFYKSQLIKIMSKVRKK